MNTQGIPIGESLSWAWERFRENVVVLVAAQLVVFILPSFIQFMGDHVLRIRALDWLVSLIVTFVALALELGFVNLVLRIHDGKAVEFGDLFETVDRAGWFFLASILMTIVVGMGLILFIIPGIYIAIRLTFIAFIIVDERANALDVFPRSWDLTRGYAFDLFLFLILMIVINIFGALLLLVGLLVTAPVTSLASAYVFRVLKDRHDGIAASTAPPVAPTSQV